MSIKSVPFYMHNINYVCLNLENLLKARLYLSLVSPTTTCEYIKANNVFDF